jgi:hypothetical protein
MQADMQKSATNRTSPGWFVKQHKLGNTFLAPIMMAILSSTLTTNGHVELTKKYDQLGNGAYTRRDGKIIHDKRRPNSEGVKKHKSTR